MDSPPAPRKSEVLRYLGYRGQELDAALDGLVDQVMAECVAVSHPLYTCSIFDLEHAPEGIRVTGTTLTLGGKDIRNHLEGAEKGAFLAATLGPAIEARIRLYEATDLTRSVMLDAAATEYIERVCDGAQGDISRSVEEQQLVGGSRFSPGYGDLPLELQPQFLAALNAGRKIGLTCTPSYILLPRKSVTAIIGLFREGAQRNPRLPRGCRGCAMAGSCIYRKGGVSCGHPKAAE